MGTVFGDFWSVIDAWVTLKYGTSGVSSAIGRGGVGCTVVVVVEVVVVVVVR